MLNNKGNSLVETLLAFSIFITVIILFVSLYNIGLKKYNESNQTYDEYLIKQIAKEQEIWLENPLNQIITTVLQ